MEEFADELRREGFQEVHYIPFIEREGSVKKFVSLEENDSFLVRITI